MIIERGRVGEARQGDLHGRIADAARSLPLTSLRRLPAFSAEDRNDPLAQRKRRERWLILLVLLLGLLFVICSGQAATAIAPRWQVAANMSSYLSVNSEYHAAQGTVIFRPVSAQILTPAVWADSFLTPQAGSGSLPTVVPPLVFSPPETPAFELRASATPVPTFTRPPPPSATPVRARTGTFTRTATATRPTTTSTLATTPSNTPEPSATATLTRTRTPIPTRTASFTRTPSRTRTPSNTPVPPTSTPSNTPVPPTSTPSRTASFTRTPSRTRTPTDTPVPPSNTPSRTRTPSNTPVPPTGTASRTRTPTDTSAVIYTSTASRTRTRTPSSTPIPPTFTPSRTYTPSDTHTFTPTDTDTPTFTPSRTHTPTPSDTHTFTPTDTLTHTPTFTPSRTHTHTPTDTHTFTPTDTDTPTFTPSHTPTHTPTVTNTPLPNNTPTADAGGPYAIAEGDPVVLDASASTDPDGDPLTYLWDLNNDAVYGDASGATPTVSWATLYSFGIDDNGSYPISVQVSDGRGGSDTAAATVVVSNTPPTLLTTGASTAIVGQVYTLNLNAVDPGEDTISSWTINWGDDTIQTYAGDPASVSHTYTRLGYTFNILASAVDEDGSYLQNDLVVGSSRNDLVNWFDTVGAPRVPAQSGPNGLDYSLDPLIGPDGYVYVSGWNSGNVVRFNASTGAFVDTFVPAGSGGLTKACGMAFGPDGNLYVADTAGKRVLRYNGTTGAFIDVFVAAGSGGLDQAAGLTFGPDGNLYVGDYRKNNVLRFNGTTGAFIDVFVAAGAGGLRSPEDLTFGPDGNLYVASDKNHNILRFNGTTGAFINIFVASGSGGLRNALGLTFGPDGNLYVGSWGDDTVKRYNRTTGAYLGDYVTAGSGGLWEPAYLNFIPEQQVLVVSAFAPMAPMSLSPEETATLDTEGTVALAEAMAAAATDTASPTFTASPAGTTTPTSTPLPTASATPPFEGMCAATASSEPAGTLYDSGGPDGSYANSEECSYRINPANGASSITLSFSSFVTEDGGDLLRVYDGSNASGTLLGTFSGSSLPASLTAQSGSLYLEWTSDEDLPMGGFSLRWDSLPPFTPTPSATPTFSPTPTGTATATETPVQVGVTQLGLEEQSANFLVAQPAGTTPERRPPASQPIRLYPGQKSSFWNLR